MVAAFHCNVEEDTSSEEDNLQDSDDEEGEEDERYGTLERTPCVVHTLQLVVNMIQKEPTIKRLLDKVRHLVKLFRKSSVATERLLQQCGLILIKDCPTRWSSSYLMMSRVLEVKDHLTSVADTMSWDGLLPSEWQKVAILRLAPSICRTHKGASNSLSLVVPALLDLRNHLSEFSLAHARSYREAATLAQKMSANMEQRFSCFLDVMADKFSPLAAAACFIDPSVSAEALIENEDEEIQNLLKKAEDYIVHSVPPRLQVQEEVTDDEENGDTEASETTHLPLPKRPRFRFFSASRPSRPRTSKTSSIRQEIQKYKEGLSHAANTEESEMEFWTSQRCTVFALLKPLALDLLVMPASQAFAERVFSVTGDLSSGRRNRARTTLERSAFLKVNKN
ncbi:hypothetical protein SKAU_G00280000 [Synaphobranchus kaupii]|uniref:Uncharacterized protein n=1 Tax=Synaphobranchus kaupii TaxID=118154 RepID=A0A9Q1IMX5_SYNKA|nr:hypothetical protein SKAU_G00280000 [Synaphobranchus kaupii]